MEKRKLSHALSFASLQLLLWPVRWLSFPLIHRLGAFLGRLLFYTSPKFRKRTLGNLALASDLKLSESELYRIAKQSLENLLITCLEYFKFASLKAIAPAARCENPEIAADLMNRGIPVIFFCGHQANWEVLFLEGTSRMPGVAIGRPVKNTVLYKWLLSIREKFGGKMIAPQNAVREGFRALKKGSFLGIVGDQGMPDSGFSSPFLGKTAWTSPLPAMLSHRTGSPILVAMTRRVNGKYLIRYSDPIWPDKTAPLEAEIDRMMKKALFYLEESIKEEPGQWLWSHNRWKQQTLKKIKRLYRQESLCIILPPDKELFDRFQAQLAAFREIYPLEFIICKAPRLFLERCTLKDAAIEPYDTIDDLLRVDLRFKLVFNLTSFSSLHSHYKKCAAFAVLDIKELQRLAKSDETDLSNLLRKALLI
jgi:KDO2-lipid IV(A) lauroyltransferase